MPDLVFAPQVVAIAGAERAAGTGHQLSLTCTADADVTPAGTTPGKDTDR